MRSLLEPERYTARIPDANGWQTTVFQTIMDQTGATGTDGSWTAGFYPIPVRPNGALEAAIQANGTQIAAQGVWTTGGQAIIPGSSASIINVCSAVRPVSGVLLVEFIGTTSNDNGQIVACPIFRGETFKASFASCIQNAYSVAAPLRNGLRFLWKPMDEMDHQFIATNTNEVPGINTPGGIGTPTGVPFPSIQTPSAGNGPEVTQTPVCIQVMVAGAQASTTVVRFRWIVNYEAIPELSTVALFAVDKEPANPGAMAAAMNVMSQVPWGDVWQGVAGIGGAMLEQAMGTQLPNYVGSLAANGMSRMLSYGGNRARGRLGGIDLSVD